MSERTMTNAFLDAVDAHLKTLGAIAEKFTQEEMCELLGHENVKTLETSVTALRTAREALPKTEEELATILAQIQRAWMEQRDVSLLAWEQFFASRLAPMMGGGECQWTKRDDDDEEDYYETECGDEIILLHGTPDDYNYRYCSTCGKRIVTARRATEGEPK